MIEDDLRMATMGSCNTPNNSITSYKQSLESSTNSSNLSDEEQLALSNCSNLFDDFNYFSPSSPSTLNSSLNLSSTGSSSATSPLSNSLINSFSSIPTSLYDDINTFSSSKYNTNQDTFILNNNNLNSSSQQQQQQQHPSNFDPQNSNTTYQIINPCDLNATNFLDNNKSQLYINDLNTNITINNNNNNNDHNLFNKATTTTTTTTTLLTTRPLKTLSTTPLTQNAKRCKNLDQTTHIFTLLNSDGDSSSQISESGDSDLSSGNTSPQQTNLTCIKSQLYTPPATPQTIHIISTTDSNQQQQQQQNHNSSSTTTTAAATAASILSSTLLKNNQLNIIKLTKDLSSPNEKQIIQYKTTLLNKTTPASYLNTTISNVAKQVASNDVKTKVFPKPPYSYSCLIAMALKNSDSGTLPVSDIYEFIM